MDAVRRIGLGRQPPLSRRSLLRPGRRVHADEGRLEPRAEVHGTDRRHTPLVLLRGRLHRHRALRLGDREAARQHRGLRRTVLRKTCTNTGRYVQAVAAVTPGHSYTLTLTSHDDNFPGDPTYTLYDDVRQGRRGR